MILLRGQGASAQEGPSADISFAVYDADGNSVPHNSPYSLAEGSTYTVVVTVTNTSTKGGVAVAATMSLSMAGTSTKKTYMPATGSSYAFPAGGSHQWSGVLTSAVGDAPDSGAIVANLDDPNNNLIATANTTFTVTALPIVYGGTIAYA